MIAAANIRTCFIFDSFDLLDFEFTDRNLMSITHPIGGLCQSGKHGVLNTREAYFLAAKPGIIQPAFWFPLHFRAQMKLRPSIWCFPA